jgi:hypothetical protein
MTQHQAHELCSGVAGPSNDDHAYGLRGHVLNSILILTCALSTALSKKAAALEAPRLEIAIQSSQRLEYWNFLRAPG